MQKALAMAVAVGCLSAGLVNAHARSKVVSPRTLTLRLSELPAGFTRTVGRSYTNAQADRADHLAPGTLARHGRITSYETEFTRSAFAGLIQVQDTVSMWRSSAGAHWQLRLSEAGAKNAYRGSRFVPMSVGQLGGEAVGYQLQSTSNGYHVLLFTVIFRRGDYAVLVLGVGLVGTLTADQVVSLAQTIDRRIPR